jgi:hypothetical protein
MEITDPIFIENNICAIHDRVINALNHLSDKFREEGNREDAQCLEEITSDVLLAKQRGIKIECRLKQYLYTIRALGFSRDKDMEQIEIIENQLRLKNNVIPNVVRNLD